MVHLVSIKFEIVDTATCAGKLLLEKQSKILDVSRCTAHEGWIHPCLMSWKNMEHLLAATTVHFDISFLI